MTASEKEPEDWTAAEMLTVEKEVELHIIYHRSSSKQLQDHCERVCQLCHKLINYRHFFQIRLANRCLPMRASFRHSKAATRTSYDSHDLSHRLLYRDVRQ